MMAMNRGVMVFVSKNITKRYRGSCDLKWTSQMREDKECSIRSVNELLCTNISAVNSKNYFHENRWASSSDSSRASTAKIWAEKRRSRRMRTSFALLHAFITCFIDFIEHFYLLVFHVLHISFIQHFTFAPQLISYQLCHTKPISMLSFAAKIDTKESHFNWNS